MRLRIGTPRVALVIAPHADDEAIGAFGLIGALRRRGTRVNVLVVTDGAASHPNSARWPRVRLVKARRAETRRAMRRLGLRASQIEMLGLPDGGLSYCPRACLARIARAIARRPWLDMVIGPVADDAHPDHRAVAQALAAARFGGRRLAYRVWPPLRSATARGASWPHSQQRLERASVIRGYRTQIGTITDDPRGFAMSGREFAAFARPIEHFVEVPRCARSG